MVRHGMTFDGMPKAELHLHLDGALPPETILLLAERNGLRDLLPGETEEAIAGWFVFQDFDHFLNVKRTIKKLLRSADDFALAVYAVGRELAAQHVRYAEITVTPYTFIDVLGHGVTLDGMFQGLESGRQQARSEFGIELRWVFDIPRNRAFADYHRGGAYVAGAAESTLAYALRGREFGVVGLGFGGNETNAPPEPFAQVFAEAKRQGLRSVPHAGESEGAASVWGAIRALQADRVGHGVRAVEDERLLDELAARQIPLEVNMTSNVSLNFCSRIQDHPLPSWIGRAFWSQSTPMTPNSSTPRSPESTSCLLMSSVTRRLMSFASPGMPSWLAVRTPPQKRGCWRNWTVGPRSVFRVSRACAPAARSLRGAAITGRV
ncbi:MAG: adenosine deaminase family protein [Anaerolineae bacterium]|nr:adenosine deaminase family protein [Anaerolineae bacterium]